MEASILPLTGGTGKRPFLTSGKSEKVRPLAIRCLCISAGLPRKTMTRTVRSLLINHKGGIKIKKKGSPSSH